MDMEGLFVCTNDLLIKRLHLLVLLTQGRLFLVLQVVGQLLFGHFLSHSLSILDGALAHILALILLLNVDVGKRTKCK